MIFNMINLSDFTTLNVFLAWLVVLSVTLLFPSILALRRSNKKLGKIKEQEGKRWHELEDKAQRDYQEILEAANKRAQEIILEASQIKSDTVSGFQNSVDRLLSTQKEALGNTSLSLSNKYKEQIEKLNEDNIKLLINIYKDIEESAKSDFAEYKELILKQTFDAQNLASNKIKTEYEKLENELTALRTKKLEELNEKIYKIIQNASIEIIGKSLDLSDQEELIISALDRAKKEEIIK